MATKAPARPTELKVKVISAKNLIAADSNGKSDPFAVVYTKSGSSGKDKSIKTKKISETLNPTWNETFNLILRDRKDSVVIEVWDDDLFGKDHLGTAEIPLEGLEHDKETALVAKLNKQGEVSVAITVRYNDKELEELQKKEEEEKKRIAAEAQKKKEEDEKRIAAEAQKKAEDDRKKKEEDDRKKAEEEKKKKDEEEKKKKEEEQKKAQQAQQQPAKATTAPATPAAAQPAPVAQPSPAQTPAKATTAPAATPAASTPAKPATTTTPASTTQSKTTSTSTPAKPATKQAEAEGPNYVLIGGVVAVLAVAGFAAFKYLHKN